MCPARTLRRVPPPRRRSHRRSIPTVAFVSFCAGLLTAAYFLRHRADILGAALLDQQIYACSSGEPYLGDFPTTSRLCRRVLCRTRTRKYPPLDSSAPISGARVSGSTKTHARSRFRGTRARNGQPPRPHLERCSLTEDPGQTLGAATTGFAGVGSLDATALEITGGTTPGGLGAWSMGRGSAEVCRTPLSDDGRDPHWRGLSPGTPRHRDRLPSPNRRENTR
jgi:hypothetical protein